jgi:flagellar biosynthesis protein
MTKKQLAVALEYGRNVTPVVTAVGEGASAQLIMEEAARQGVPIACAPELASALASIEVDEVIPERVFVAVAVILSWVYWLKGMVPGDEKNTVRHD